MPRPPSTGAVSSPYGMRFNPNDGIYRMHYGEDTLGVGNTAPANGVVVFAGWDKTGTGLGWAIGIRENANPDVIWWIAHHGTTSLWNPLKVAVGFGTVEGVTYLGPKGYTGAAKGEHAHTERRVGGAARPGSGTPTNPRNYYTGGAGGGGLPIITKRRDDMPAVIKRNTEPPEWSLVHPALRGPSALEVGYIVTEDAGRAKWWARFYAEGIGSEDEYAREDYIAAQASARLDASAWVVSGGATIPAGLATKADVDAAAAAVISEVEGVPDAVADEQAERLQS
jgi:hypothetical protein